MKKLLQSLFMLMLLAGSALAQQRTITGTVTGKEDGLPLPGVSVKLQGAQGGAVTGADGKYIISAAASATGLAFSSLGYLPQSKTIGQATVINVILANDTQTLTEVTITSALGITRTERSIGTAQQSLKGADLTQTKQLDLNTALAGKIAGVQVLGGSGARFGDYSEQSGSSSLLVNYADFASTIFLSS